MVVSQLLTIPPWKQLYQLGCMCSSSALNLTNSYFQRYLGQQLSPDLHTFITQLNSRYCLYSFLGSQDSLFISLCI